MENHLGSVNGVTYRIIRSEQDREEAVRLQFEVFAKDEPLNRILDTCEQLLEKEEEREKRKAVFRKVISEGACSIIAIDDETGGTAGVRASSIVARGDAPRGQPSASKRAEIVRRMFDEFLPTNDLFETRPDLRKIFVFHAVCVDRRFRGRGVATQSILLAMEVAKREGCGAAVAISTNVHTRKIFEKLGFRPWISKQRDEVTCFRPYKMNFAEVDFPGIVSYWATIEQES